MARERSERDRKLDELARRYRERLAQEWPEGETDVTRIEEIVARVERETMKEIAEEMIREQTGKRKGNQTTCPCGSMASYRKQTEITLVTAFGRIRAQRAYFYCSNCRDGHCPQDIAWGIGPGHTTPTVQSVVGYLAATEAYVQVPRTLKRAAPRIHLGTKTVELIAQRLGEQARKKPARVEETASERDILAVAVDAAMLPTRSGYKEARCGVIYEPQWDPSRTPAAEAALRKEFVGTLGSRESLMTEVCARVERRRPAPAARVAALGDGADWIWQQYEQRLPNRIEILDFYHAMEHVGVLAQARFGEAPTEAAKWRDQTAKKLKQYGASWLVREVERWEPEGEEAQKVKRLELAYLRRNEHRMKYPRFLRQALPIGSGAVEGACKHLVADRFKGSGMRWNVATAEPLLHLRAALLTKPDLDLRPYAMTA
jgi:hypothetical protein